MVYIAPDGQVLSFINQRSPEYKWRIYTALLISNGQFRLFLSPSLRPFSGASGQTMGDTYPHWLFMVNCDILPAFLQKVVLLPYKWVKNRRFKMNAVLLALGSNRIHFSLIDPSSTGKGEGWTSPQYRNTGGRGPPPNGGPRRWRSLSSSVLDNQTYFRRMGGFGGGQGGASPPPAAMGGGWG